MKDLVMRTILTAAILGLSVVTSPAGPATITAAAKTLPTNTKQPQLADKSAAPAVSFKSEFIVPRKVSEGRDPFFPESNRPFITESIVKTTSTVSTPDVEFVLKGIAGTAEQPLAIINTTTFTSGEANEVIIKSQRFKIRCVEINVTAGTALIEYGGSRRQLKLQPY